MASRRGPDNSVRLSISGTRDGVAWANVFHAQLATSSSIVQADLDSWVNTVQAAWKTRFGSFMANSVLSTLAKCVLYAPGGGELISSVNMTGGGTSGSAYVADSSAAKVVSWLSSVYWRGGKPRTYLPGVLSGDMANTHSLDATVASNLQAAAANFRSDVNAATAGTITGSALGFISYMSGNAPRVPPVFYPFTGAAVHLRLGSQRRRLGAYIP